MGLRDVTGVLSRYFVLGYFVPAFFTLFVLSQLLTSTFLPDAYERLKTQNQVLVIGAGSLFAGLVLLGLRYPIIRVFEGYPLELGPLRRLRRPFVALQRRSYEHLAKIRDDKDDPRRSTAARLLDRRFHQSPKKLLPTRFGNAMRASENYSYTRWGIDSVAFWPRIDPLLSAREQELHANALSDLAFFVNGAIGALVATLVLVVDEIKNAPLQARYGWAYAVPPFLAYLLYRAAIGAAERLGTERRASIDLHRRELYTQLGVRTPNSFTEEREAIAPALNRLFLYRIPVPDSYSAPPTTRKEVTKNGD